MKILSGPMPVMWIINLAEEAARVVLKVLWNFSEKLLEHVQTKSPCLQDHPCF